MRTDASVTNETEVALQRISRLFKDMSRPANVISASVSIAEARVDDIIDALVVHDRANDTPLGRMLIGKSNLRQNWRSRHEALAEGFSVVINPPVLVRRMDLVVDVRNALAHGDGRLTDWQTRSWATALQLRRDLERELHVQTDGRALVLDLRSTETALLITKLYLIELDRAVRRRQP